MKKKSILCIGEIIWDLFDEEKALGGAPINVARHLLRLGDRATVLSAVGNDPLGREALEQLESFGIKGKIRIDPHRPTGTARVIYDADAGELHRFEIARGVAWEELVRPSQLESAQKVTANLVVFGTLAMNSATNREWFSHLPEEVVKLCDLNLRAPHYDDELIEWALQQSHYLKINEEERDVLAQRMKDVDWEGLELHDRTGRVEKVLLERYPIRGILTTMGAEGVLWSGASGVVQYRPATPFETLVDTVGAGDSVTAILAHQLLSPEWHASAMLREAAELAAVVCQTRGPFPDD